MAVTGTPRIVTDGLVLYIDAANTKSYPGSGTVWTDLSPTQITGSLTNGPTFNSANGGSIFFDGTDDIVDLGTNNTLNFTDSFSVSFWMRANLSIANKAQFFLNRWTWDSGSFRQWTFDNIIQRIPGSVIGTNSIAFSISSAGTDGTSVIISSSNSAYSNNWVNVCGIWDKTNIYLYINGVSANTPVAASSMVSTPDRKTFIGGTLSANIPVTGSIAMASFYNRALSTDEVLQNYESTREKFNLMGIAIDPDASLFLRTAGITNTTQQSAIDTLVLELKNAGIWSKMRAIYPFVGGTASTHRWNLKDPRDLDAAFRLTFSGGWTHSSTGAKGNGSNAWANTNLNARNNLTNGDFSISCYVVTGTVNGSNYSGEINCNANPYDPAGLIGLRVFNRLLGSAQFNGGDDRTESAAASSTTLGYAIGSETSNSNRKFYKNNSLLATNTTNSTTLLQNGNLWLLWGGIDYATSELALVHIGSSLTDAEASSLYTIVQKYQTTLGRQV